MTKEMSIAHTTKTNPIATRMAGVISLSTGIDTPAFDNPIASKDGMANTMIISSRLFSTPNL